MNGNNPVPSGSSESTKQGAKLAEAGGAAAFLLGYYVASRVIGMFVLIFGIVLGGALGGGILIFVCPVLLGIGYWIILARLKLGQPK